MPTISYQGTVVRVKQVICDRKGWNRADYNQVLVAQVLRDHPLRFALPGLRAISKNLNDEFQGYGLVITPSETGGTKIETVGNLCELVWSKIPPTNQV